MWENYVAERADDDEAELANGSAANGAAVEVAHVTVTDMVDASDFSIQVPPSAPGFRSACLALGFLSPPPPRLWVMGV